MSIMRYAITNMLLILALSASGQTYFGVNTQRYVIGIADASATQRLNGKRQTIAFGVILRLSMDMRQNTDTFINIWSSLAGFMPVLGDTAQSTALVYDAKRLSTGTINGTNTFYKDSIRSNGTSGYYKTGYTMTSGTVTDMMLTYYSTTDVGVPANVPTDMGGTSTDAGRVVLAIRASGGTGNGTLRIQNYSSGNVTQAYPAATTTVGAFSQYRTSSTNIRTMRQQTVLGNTTNTAGNFSPAELNIFRCTDGSFAYTNRACAAAAWGNGFTDAMTASLHRALAYKMSNL